MRINKVFVVVLVLLNLGYIAQPSTNSFAKSTLVLISEDKNGEAKKYSINENYMVLNISNGDFILNADLSGIRTGIFNIDSLIQSFGPQPLVFNGNISDNILVFNQKQNDEKTYPMSGTLKFNQSNFSCVAQFDPINLAEKSESNNYRMDFTLTVDASKINIKGFEMELSKQIVFEVNGGKLNIQQ